jgi:hypothetical protein
MSESVLLSIKSNDNAVELTLSDATVTMKLSESLLQEVDGEMQRDLQHDSDVAKGGLAGRFAQFVTNAVGSMLHQTIQYALADIKSVEYQNGGLVFAYNRKHTLSFEAVNIGSKPALQSFTEADARAFADRFTEVKAGHA